MDYFFSGKTCEADGCHRRKKKINGKHSSNMTRGVEEHVNEKAFQEFFRLFFGQIGTKKNLNKSVNSHESLSQESANTCHVPEKRHPKERNNVTTFFWVSCRRTSKRDDDTCGKCECVSLFAASVAVFKLPCRCSCWCSCRQVAMKQP